MWAKTVISCKVGCHFLAKRRIPRVLVDDYAVCPTVFAARITLQWRGGIPSTRKKAVPFWPFVVRNGPSWNLGMRTVVWVEYSPQVSMERQTYILFPLLALNFRSFSRVKKCYDVSRRALLCGGGGEARLSEILVNFGPTYHSIIITSRTHTVNGQSLYNVYELSSHGTKYGN